MQYQATARRLDASGSLATSHGAEVRLGTDIEARKDAPPMLTAIRYEITVVTKENDARLDLLHGDILK